MDSSSRRSVFPANTNVLYVKLDAARCALFFHVPLLACSQVVLPEINVAVIVGDQRGCSAHYMKAGMHPRNGLQLVDWV